MILILVIKRTLVKMTSLIRNSSSEAGEKMHGDPTRVRKLSSAFGRSGWFIAGAQCFRIFASGPRIKVILTLRCEISKVVFYTLY